MSEGVVCEEHAETHGICELNLADCADGNGISFRMDRACSAPVGLLLTSFETSYDNALGRLR